MQDALIDLLRAREGHFLLESGHHGALWLDLDLLFLRPRRLRRIIAELASRLSAHNVDAVCGPLTGGAFVAQMIAAKLDIAFLYAERCTHARSDALYSAEYRIPNALYESVMGKNVAIVDDVINAGSAIRGTATALQGCDANVVAIGALLVLGPSAAEFATDQHIPLERVAYLANTVWTPSECPLCTSGLPLERLVGHD